MSIDMVGLVSKTCVLPQAFGHVRCTFQKCVWTCGLYMRCAFRHMFIHAFRHMNSTYNLEEGKRRCIYMCGDVRLDMLLDIRLDLDLDMCLDVCTRLVIPAVL